MAVKGYVAAGVITLAALATLLVPVSQPPVPKDAPGIDFPAVAVCPVEEGQGRSTTIGVISPVSGPGLLTIFAGGGATGSATFDISASGSTTVDVVDVSAVGVAGALAELPDSTAAAGTVVTGSDFLAAEGCEATPFRQTILAGGSSLSGESLEFQLMNPYAGDATVALTVWSEAGLESDPAFDSVIVPARSSTTLDLRDLLPGRAMLSATFDVTSGSVLPVGRFSNGSDGAIWHAVAPAEEWFVPAPGGQDLRRVVIATASSADVSYQVDLYGADGLDEGFAEGVIPAHGAATIDLGSVSSEAVAFRIIATAPVAPFLRLDTGGGVAITAGADGTATTWVMPGAGAVVDASTSVIVFNPGLEDASVLLREGGNGIAAREILVPAASVITVDLSPGLLDGLSIDATVPIVSLSMMSSAPKSAIALGVPTGNG